MLFLQRSFGETRIGLINSGSIVELNRDAISGIKPMNVSGAPAEPN